jgi:hypothetical protein
MYLSMESLLIDSECLVGYAGDAEWFVDDSFTWRAAPLVKVRFFVCCTHNLVVS